MSQITKSLFVDYCESPKIAWWKANNLPVYKKIKGLEIEDTADQLVELGQKVEDVVGEYLFNRYGNKKINLFEDNEAKNPFDEEDEDIYLVQEPYRVKLARNLERTLQAIKNKEKLIYQPGFLVDGLFVRADYMILNSKGNYDLIEVKAKTGVRKDKTFKKVINKKIGNLENKFLSDISFQKYVINKFLGSQGLGGLDKLYFAYLNSNYVKIGKLNINELIILDQVDTEKTIILQSEDDSKEELISDFMLEPGIIEEKVQRIKDELILSEEKFNKIHTFTGSKYLEYFGDDRPFGTIYSKGITSATAVKSLHYQNKIVLDELKPSDLDLFNTKDGSLGSARIFIDKYLKSKKENKDLIELQEIKNELQDLKYPICFYDYETCSVSIPFLDHTSPYQQVVVQYSLHKLYEDGKIEHYGGVLAGTGERSIKQIKIEINHNRVDFESEKIITGNYKDLLDEFVKDIGEDINSSFIVWYKPFESTRNKEIAETFKDLEDVFLNINENTYDLMDIFKKGYYFSLDFKGSNSIKFVLPALIPSMTYKGMGISDGLTAMKILNDLINGNIKEDERDKIVNDLLLYCGQDSLAMYRIFANLKGIVIKNG